MASRPQTGPALWQDGKVSWWNDTQEANILPGEWEDITKSGHKLEGDVLALALQLLVEKEDIKETLVLSDVATQMLFEHGYSKNEFDTSQLEITSVTNLEETHYIIAACSDAMVERARGSQSQGYHWGLLIVDMWMKQARFIDSYITLNEDMTEIEEQLDPVVGGKNVVKGIEALLHKYGSETTHAQMKFDFIPMMYTPQQKWHNRYPDDEDMCGPFAWGTFEYILMKNSLHDIDSLFPLKRCDEVSFDSKELRKSMKGIIHAKLTGQTLQKRRVSTPPLPPVANASEQPYDLEGGKFTYHDGEQADNLARQKWVDSTTLSTDLDEEFLHIALDALVESLEQPVHEEGSTDLRSRILVLSKDNCDDLKAFVAGRRKFARVQHMQDLIKDARYRWIVVQVFAKGDDKQQRGLIIVDKHRDKNSAQILNIWKNAEVGDTSFVMNRMVKGLEALLDEYEMKSLVKQTFAHSVFNREDRRRLQIITIINVPDCNSRNTELKDGSPAGPFVYGILRHILRQSGGLQNIQTVFPIISKLQLYFNSTEIRYDMKHRVWWKCRGQSFKTYKPHQDAPAEPSLAPTPADPVLHGGGLPPRLPPPPTDDTPPPNDGLPNQKPVHPPRGPSPPPRGPSPPPAKSTLPGGLYNAESDIRQLFHEFVRRHTIPFHELSDEAIDEWIEVIRQAGLSEEHRALRRSLDDDDDDDDDGENKKQENQKEKEKEKEQKDEPEKRTTRQSEREKEKEKEKQPAKELGKQPRKSKEPGKDPEKKTEAQIEYEAKMKKKRKNWKKRAFLQKAFGDIDDLKFIALHQWRKTDPTMVNSRLGVDITRTELHNRRPDVPFNINYTGIWRLYPQSYLQWFLEDVERIIRLREPGIFPDLEGWQEGDTGRPGPDDKNDEELRKNLVDQWFNKNPKSGGKSTKKTAEPSTGEVMTLPQIIATYWPDKKKEPTLNKELRERLHALGLIDFERHPDLDKSDRKWDTTYRAILHAGKYKTFSNESEKDCKTKWTKDLNVFKEGKKEDGADFKFKNPDQGSKTTIKIAEVYRSLDFIKKRLNETYCRQIKDPLDGGDDDGGGGGAGGAGGEDKQQGNKDDENKNGKDGENGKNSNDDKQGEKVITALNAAFDEHEDLIDLVDHYDPKELRSWIYDLPEVLREGHTVKTLFNPPRRMFFPVFRYNTYIFELIAMIPEWTSVLNARGLVERLFRRSDEIGDSTDDRLRAFLNTSLLGPVERLEDGAEYPKHPNLQIPDVLAQTGSGQRGRKRSRESILFIDQPAPKKTRIEPPGKEASQEFAPVNGFDNGVESYTEIEPGLYDKGIPRPPMEPFTPPERGWTAINLPQKRNRRTDATEETEENQREQKRHKKSPPRSR